MIRASLPVAVFVLFSSLASWTQITQTNEPVRDPLSARPADGVAGQMDEIQPVAPSGTRPQSRKGPLVIREVKHDTGPLLREIAPLLPEFSTPSEHEIENNVNPNHHWSNRVQKDTMLQTEENSPALQTPNFGLEFDGAGFGDSFFCYCMPPDNDGAAGTTQYVQYINVEYQVFDKSGNTVLGPLSGNAFWSGFGGSCQADNSGDPVLRFDAAAQRWVVAQFAINNSGPDYECVAVSTTADATGSYNRYAFPFTISRTTRRWESGRMLTTLPSIISTSQEVTLSAPTSARQTAPGCWPVLPLPSSASSRTPTSLECCLPTWTARLRLRRVLPTS
jgi:hypothetical protein